LKRRREEGVDQLELRVREVSGEEVDLEGVPLPRSSLRRDQARHEVARMKKIEAIIKPFQLEEVKSGLAELGIEGMTVTEVKGFPAGFVEQRTHTGLGAPRFLPKLKVELVVRNDLLGSAIAAIKECARPDRNDNGKIFVQDLLEVIRIRTEERGERAI
jgi:nitrogen regulatory protein P-II 1